MRRGHDVTCLARGSAEPPAGATFVSADRDLEDGLAPVAGEEWDAVVDVTRHPGHARRAVRDLVAAHRVLVSTGNVYARFDRLEQDEDSPLRAPLDGDVMTSMEVYGEAKVACENAVRAADGPAAIVRSGLIGGPGDWSGRTGYWPWRFAHPVGERVVVPDDLDFPCAMIDVRDLAAWLVTASEQRLDGTFNATGPTTPLHDVLATSARVAGSTATPLPVGRDRLAELGIGAWMGPASLPLWIDDEEWRGFATLATGAGPRRRPDDAPARGDAARHARVRGDAQRTAGGGAAATTTSDGCRRPCSAEPVQPLRWVRCRGTSRSSRRGR